MERDFNKNSKKFKLKLIVYSDRKTILRDFQNQKIQMLITHPFFYFENKKILDKIHKQKWILQFNKKNADGFYLLANKSNKNIYKNISKYEIYTLDGIPDTFHWVDYLFFKKHNINLKKQAKELHYMTKENKILYRVFFDKYKLGVIRKDSYELFIELNPQLKDKIVILDKSENIFLSYIGLNHISTRQEDIDELFNTSQNIRKVLNNSKMTTKKDVTIFLIKGKKELDPFFKFYKEYQLLKNRKN